jgi:hypothetical protein
VHNRSHLKANNVSVWAIYANATKGIPLLDARGNMNMPFQFWSQFGQDGRIYPNLPVDSPWRSFGMPVVLSGIDAANPQVATWNWTVPGNFDPFNYCVGIFVHCSVSPLVESSVNLSDFAGQQPQVGQLLIGGLVPYQQPMGIVAQTVKKALVGVRETSNIFVDPLWDPIRGEITFGITVRRFFSSLLLRVTQQSLAGLDRSFSRVHAASPHAVVTRPSQVPPPMRDEIDTSSTGPDPTLSAFRKEGLARIERLRGTLTR